MPIRSSRSSWILFVFLVFFYGLTPSVLQAKARKDATEKTPLPDAGRQYLELEAQRARLRSIRFGLMPSFLWWKTRFGYEGISTSENYDASGSKQAISNNGKIFSNRLLLESDYSVSKKVTALFRFDYRIVKGSITTSSGSGNNSTFGSGDLGLGALWNPKPIPFLRNLDIESVYKLLFTIPTYRNSNVSFQTQPVIGNGDTWVSLGIVTKKTYGDYAGLLDLSVKHYVTHLGTTLPVELEFRREAGTETWLYGGALKAEWSLNDGKERGGRSGVGLAFPSNLYNKANSSSVEFDPWVGYTLSKRFLLKGSLSYPIYGKNSWSGIGGGISVTYFDNHLSLFKQLLGAEAGGGESMNFSSAAKVNRVSKKGITFLLDVGIEDGVIVGKSYKVYASRKDVPLNPVALARVTKVTTGSSNLQVLRYYSKTQEIEPSMLAIPVAESDPEFFEF